MAELSCCGGVAPGVLGAAFRLRRSGARRCSVASTFDSLDQDISGDVTRRFDPRRLGRQVDTRGADAGHFQQRLLDPGDAGRAGHAGDRQLGRLCHRGVARRKNRIGYGSDIGSSIDELDIRALRREIDRDAGNALHPGDGALHPPDARRAGHAIDGQRQPFVASRLCLHWQLRPGVHGRLHY